MSPSSGSTPSVRAYTNFSHWITRLIMAGYSGVGAPRHSGAAAENLLEEEVTQSNSKILLWSLAGLTFLFVATRCFLRFKAFRRLPVDDILIILSWTIFVANFVVWVVLSPTHYADLDGAKKNGRFIEPDEYVAWAKLRLLTSVLFYMSLWTVKISVLLFFRRLGDQIRSHRIWWWCVMNLTVSIWIICLANTGWECGTRSRQWIQENCYQLRNSKTRRIRYLASCSLDVFSDLLIISVPVYILWHVPIPIRKKLILFGILCASIVVIVITIARVVVLKFNRRGAEVPWLIL